MTLAIISLVIGLVILVIGADILVKGAGALAKRFGVSQTVVGLTVVAFGTSAPELVVNITAALSGDTDIAIGNVVGSNIANILLILGISAMFATLRVERSTTWKEVPFAALAIIMLFVLGNDRFFDGGTNNTLWMGDGLVLLGFFAIFMYYIWGLAMNTPAPSQNDDLPEYESGRATTYTLLGLVGLFVGGKMLVSGAVTLAEAAGISQMLIGLTIVAVGTSLPELAASVMAAQRGMADMAVGNVVGSNIFNVFWILGVTAIMEPMPLSNAANTDLLVCLGATFAMFFALSASGRHRITRIEGGVFVAAYIAYTVYLVMRG